MTRRDVDPVPPTGIVEAKLRLAASAAVWPATPDLRDGVLTRIAAANRDRGSGATAIARTRLGRADPRPAPRPTGRPLLRALVLALLAVVAIAGAAAALGYRLPGLEIVFVESLPPAGVGLDLGSPVPPAGGGLDLGSPVPLGVARAGAPRVLLPSALPPPTTAWVAGAGDREIVTLAWRAAAGDPTLPDSDLSVLVMAVAGRIDAPLLTKALPPGVRIQPVTVDGDPGWWISGGVHELFFDRPDGNGGTLVTRLAGDTLVFSRDGTLYRVESALGRDATVALAETMR